MYFSILSLQTPISHWSNINIQSRSVHRKEMEEEQNDKT